MNVDMLLPLSEGMKSSVCIEKVNECKPKSRSVAEALVQDLLILCDTFVVGFPLVLQNCF